jgi:2-polyprenyl-6-methoxyphenol hydroxylase-like FAD-dependent oxidoreductase
MSIPRPLISRSALASLRADAELLLPWSSARMVPLCLQPFVQPICDLERRHRRRARRNRSRFRFDVFSEPPGVCAGLEDALIRPRMVVGRAALLGGAVFIARAHVGAGVSKAAQDAMALVDAPEAAGDDVPPGLAACSAARHPVNTRIIRHAQELGTCMVSEGMGAAEQRMQMHAPGRSGLLADTAVLDLLQA